jgi:hypothetical protein
LTAIHLPYRCLSYRFFLTATSRYLVERGISFEFRLGVSDLNRENFPTIAVGIGDPRFILKGKATIDVHLIERDKTRFLESISCRQDLIGGRYFDAQVI